MREEKRKEKERDRKKEKISLFRADIKGSDLWDSRMSLKGEPLRTEVVYCEQSVRTGGGVGVGDEGSRMYMQGPQFDWKEAELWEGLQGCGLAPQ